MEELKKEIHLVKDADGSRAILFKNWFDKDKADTLLKYCHELETKLYPFRLKQNRLLWACGDPGVYHSFRDVNVDIHEWPPELKKIHSLLLKCFDVYTNFCLVNHYRNGYDSVASHSDGELFAKNKSVFTISLGATRKMRLVSYKTGFPDIVFALEHGDLFLMCGNVQSKWKHGIDIESNVKDPRYSLTLRSTLLRKKLGQ
jgi:alkylated DNA repair dioxygenase AlkB